MKIIEPSATIIEDELSKLSIYQRIAYVAGVCYQREPRKTEEEAQAFCRRMVEIGHYSTLEMAVVHLIMPTDFACFADGEKYLLTRHLPEEDKVVVSGSIRAFLELEDNGDWVRGRLLAHHYDLFFAVKSTLKSEHVRFATPDEIPWQHRHVAVRFVINRAVSHELVRHRPCAYLQESQRYCRYDDEVTFIRPEWYDDYKYRDGRTIEHVWHERMASLEQAYKVLMNNGLSPQQARAVLPNSTKTEIIMYANLPQWQHVFNLRCSHAADPEMRRVMVPLREEFAAKYPEEFE